MPTRVTRRVLAGRLLRDWQRAGGQGTRSPGTQVVSPHAFTITPWMSNSAEVGRTINRAASTSFVGLGYDALAALADADLGDSVSWYIEMAAGTWSIKAICFTDATSGIYSVKIDGTTVGSFDFYSASGTFNVAMTITGVSVPSSGVRTLTLEATGKNASSADYCFRLAQISGVKTA